jgi:ribosomal-protein-alanine N-acetyltransferase
MRFRFRDFTETDARTIAAWHYEPPYDVYDMVQDPADLESMLNPQEWPDVWFAASDVVSGELTGFAELHLVGDMVEIGLGLRPDLTGAGFGPAFTEAVMTFARERWRPARFALDVFPWNERAIRAYEKTGFVRGDVYIRRFPGGTEREFLRMERPA